MKFIHLADVHLGAVPDRGTAWSDQREKEIWDTFRRIIAGIRKNPVDLLFIAGDLFHRQPLLRELREVNKLFASIPNTNVYIIAGNHDYLDRRSGYRDFRFADNVIFFDSEELMCIDDDRVPVTVYGFSYCHQELPSPLLQYAVPEEGEGYHILLAHGGDARHVPIDYEELFEAGFDYAALGHIHKMRMMEEGKICFPGSPEPLDRTETGPHGYIEGWTEDGEIRTKFVPCSVRTYETVTLFLDEESTNDSLASELSDEIEDRGRDNIYRVVLKGERSPELLLIPEKLKNCGNVVEVCDESRPVYDVEQLKKQYAGTLIGDYIRFFTDRNISETEEKALYYGLQALLETSRPMR